MSSESYWVSPRDFFGKVSPGPLAFVIALILMFIGALVPALHFIYRAGLFIIGFFVLLWVVWIIFKVNNY